MVSDEAEDFVLPPSIICLWLKCFVLLYNGLKVPISQNTQDAMRPLCKRNETYANEEGEGLHKDGEMKLNPTNA